MRKFKGQSAANKIFIIFFLVILILHAVSLMAPILWTLNASFLDNYTYIMSPFSLATKPVFNNYVLAFKNLNVEVWSNSLQARVRYNIINMLGISIAYALIISFSGVFLPSLLAYPVAKYKFRGRNLLYQINIIVMILPIIGSLPSALAVRKALNMYDNFLPFVLTSSGAFGFNFLLLYGAFKGLPDSYKEAAMIDGAGHYTIMFRIFYPMAMPLMAALFMLAFIGAWNDYMTMVIWLPSWPNLAYGLYIYQSKALVAGYTMPEVLAGFVIIAIPTALLWGLGQKVITKNMVVGGLKG